MSDTSAFCYVDTARGGMDHRNRVMRRSEFRWSLTDTDVLTTLWSYGPELLAWRNSHRNKNGNPTVEGYRGPCTASAVYFDFDSTLEHLSQQENLARAQADAQRFVRFLLDEIGVDPAALRLRFSGSKGFRVDVPATLWRDGGFEPDANLPARQGVIAEHFAKTLGLSTLDLDIYNPLRLSREPNTRHGKTRLFAVPLTAEELLTLGIPAIVTLARHPRDLPPRQPDEEWVTRADLVSLWQRSEAAARAKEAHEFTRDEAGKIPSGSRHNFLIRQNALLEHGGTSEAGRRAALLALNDTELAEALPESEVRQIAAHEHPDGERDAWGDAEDLASLKRDLAEAQTALERVGAARDLAEQKEAKARRLLNHIAELGANAEFGAEKWTLILLTIADWRNDPLLSDRLPGGYRVTTGKTAAKLLGRCEKQALNHINLIAEHGLISITKVDRPTGKYRADGTPLFVPVTAFRFPGEDEDADQLAADNHLSILRAAERMRCRTKPGPKSFPTCLADEQHPVGRKLFYYCKTDQAPIAAVDGTWQAPAPGNDFPLDLERDGNDFRPPPTASAPPPPAAGVGGCPRCHRDGTADGVLCDRCTSSYGPRGSVSVTRLVPDGRCGRCKGPAPVGKFVCDACLAAGRLYGIACRRCGRGGPGYGSCVLVDELHGLCDPCRAAPAPPDAAASASAAAGGDG